MKKYPVILSPWDSHHTDVYIATEADAAQKFFEDVNVELRERIQRLVRMVDSLREDSKRWEAEARRLGCKWPLAE